MIDVLEKVCHLDKSLILEEVSKFRREIYFKRVSNLEYYLDLMCELIIIISNNNNRVMIISSISSNLDVTISWRKYPSGWTSRRNGYDL